MVSSISRSIIYNMDTSINLKVRENRARRMAQRQGFRLEKSRRRDPRAYDYGKYLLIDVDTNAVVYGGPGGGFRHGPNLEDIERWLTEDDR
jgi:hypothetical protein